VDVSGFLRQTAVAIAAETFLPLYIYYTNVNTMTTHVITLPKWILVLRAFQLLFAVIVLGVSAYGLYWIAFNVSTRKMLFKMPQTCC
jgi:hypothetical protein